MRSLNATPEEWVDAYGVRCPQCDAARGEICTTGPGGPYGAVRPLLSPHPLRELATLIALEKEGGA